MRNLTPALFNAMQEDSVITFLLVKIGPTRPSPPRVSYSFLSTTLPYEITHAGDTYAPANGLLKVDPPRLSEVLDRDAYRIEVADPEFLIRPRIADGGFSGSNMHIRAGFIDKDTGLPHGEYIDIYKGYIDSVEYAINPQEEVILRFEGVSPMGAFDLTRALITSKNFLDHKYPSNNDTSYDQVLVGSEPVNLLWGKIED